jgi:hypothetical protein
MDLLTELKKRGDANGDGKINAKDLEDLQGQFKQYSGVLGNLKGLADSNGDGKIDFSDAQGILDKVNMLDSLSGKGKNKGGILGKLGSLFGKK